MPRTTRWNFASAAIFSSLLGLLSVAGCSIGTVATGDFVENPGLTISGHVHGGAYPIQLATITLMETQRTVGKVTTTSTYGGALNTAGTAPATGSAAKSLTTATSDSHGYFTFTNYSGCDAGQYVYAVVTGGQTVSGSINNNVVQVGVIGLCDTALANPGNVNIFLSELSTVATAYALSNYIGISPNDASGKQIVNINAPVNNSQSSGSCTGTGNSGSTLMTCTASGLANGFANAINLVDSVRFDGTFPSGTANSTFLLNPNTQAVVPQALINNLGNILQSCVDSAGVANNSPACNNLFTAATPPSWTNAAAPQNTLQVALNMAMYPTNNVDALFSLKPANPFFTPDLATDTWSGTSCPTGSTTCANYISYALSIFYTGTGLKNASGSTEAIQHAVDVALDAGDNAYVLTTATTATGVAYGALEGFAPNGTGLFLGTHQTLLSAASGIALDNLGNAWVTNDAAAGSLYGLSTAKTTGGTILQTLAVGNGYPAGVAVDLSNDVWVSRDSADSNQSLFRFVPTTSGSTTAYNATTFTTAPSIQASVTRLQLDWAQNLFTVTNTMGTPNVASGGVAILEGLPFGSNGSSATLETVKLGASGGAALAVSKATSPSNGGQAYFPLVKEVDSASGTTNSLASGTAGTDTGITGSNNPAGAAIDSAGTLYWTDNEKTGQVFQLVQSTGNGASSGTSLTSGHLVSFAPCFVVALKCHVATNGTNLKGMAIDSSGAMWYVANDADYAVVQTLGLAAPSWPLISYAHGATLVQ